MPGDQSSLHIRLRLFFERCHIDHKAVFHIAFEHAFVGGVDVLNVDHFDIAGDVMFGAEVEHFLRFRQAADE